MKKVFSVIIATLLPFLLFGCVKSNIDMTFLKTPSSIDLTDYQDAKVNSIKEELKNLNKSNNKDEEVKNKLLSELGSTFDNSTVQINDKQFINKIINKIKDSSGSKIINGHKYASNKALYDLHLNYSHIKITENNIMDLIKEGYISDIWVFEDKLAVISKYDENAQNKIMMVGVTLDDDTFSYIKEYYKSKLK